MFMCSRWGGLDRQQGLSEYSMDVYYSKELSEKKKK